jgi:6-pyruvoyltetrahydropterin/6-carboxytetrahydropterin synthase
MRYISTKIIPMGSTAFRQWRADSHCKLIHGYRLQCKLWFTAEELDDKNWIYDFGGCKEIKNILEKQYDHTTVVAADDPELDTFKLMSEKGMIDLRIAEKGVGIERTAEWVYENANKFVTEQTNNRVRIIKVEVWEHEGNSAIYEELLNTTKDEGHIVEDAPEVDKDKLVTTKKDKETFLQQLAKEQEIEATAIKNDEVKNEPVVEEKPRTQPLISKKTTGYSGLFDGTSWGN